MGMETFVSYKQDGRSECLNLGEDDSLSIQEVHNHLYAVAHLGSNMLGHGNDSAQSA